MCTMSGTPCSRATAFAAATTSLPLSAISGPTSRSLMPWTRPGLAATHLAMAIGSISSMPATSTMVGMVWAKLPMLRNGMTRVRAFGWM